MNGIPCFHNTWHEIKLNSKNLEQKMLNVLLADDHNVVRNGFQVMLEMDKDIKIVGEAVNGREVLKQINSGVKADIVLTDINMPEMDGIALIKELKDISPETKVVILSMYAREEYINQAFLAGAGAYLIKTVGYDELIFALKHVHAGGRYLSSEVAMSMFDQLLRNEQQLQVAAENTVDLSAREMEVLNLMAEGMTNYEMSEKLFLSKRTIEGHRQSLMDKTGSRNTVSLMRFALKHGIID
jgi:DNA-binding NarL/FixJ family response regulator